MAGTGIWTRIAAEVRRWARELWRTRKPKARRSGVIGRFLADRKRRSGLAALRLTAARKAALPSRQRVAERSTASGTARDQVLMQAMGYLAGQPGQQAPAKQVASALRKPTKTVVGAMSRGHQVRQIKRGIWSLSATNQPRAGRGKP